MYIFILLGVLMILYFTDTYLTLDTFSKKGYRVEENPLLRENNPRRNNSLLEQEDGN